METGHGSAHETKGVCGWCHSSLGAGHGLACGLWTVGKVLFVLGLVALIGAWVTHYQESEWLGMNSEHLFHDAIVFFVLALMFKMKAKWMKGCKGTRGGCGSGSCGMGGCGGACGDCGCGPASGGGTCCQGGNCGSGGCCGGNCGGGKGGACC